MKRYSRNPILEPVGKHVWESSLVSTQQFSHLTTASIFFIELWALIIFRA